MELCPYREGFAHHQRDCMGYSHRRQTPPRIVPIASEVTPCHLCSDDLSQLCTETLDFFLCIEIVHRGAYETCETARIHIQQR